MRIIYVIILMIPGTLLILGCSEEKITNDNTEFLIENSDKIFITDRTGKKWDITRAQIKYGMRAENFRHGLGPYAIQPINNPKMILPGEPGYPYQYNDNLVIGTKFNDDARAYPLYAMKVHEVVNDIFSEQAVAVTF